MITLAGFDMSSFHCLLDLFVPIFEGYTPFVEADVFIVRKISKRGRSHFITPTDCLGLVLEWSHICVSLMVLQLIFVPDGTIPLLS